MNLADGECPSFLPWPLALTQDLGPGAGLAGLMRIYFPFWVPVSLPDIHGNQSRVDREGPHLLVLYLPQLSFVLRSFNKKLFGQKSCVCVCGQKSCVCVFWFVSGVICRPHLLPCCVVIGK